MKIFLSWSGEQSKKVASALREWIPKLLPGTEPWISNKDIYAGARWDKKLQESLKASQFGIVCITRYSLLSQWVHFEAGALSKSFQNAFVVPFLIDVPKAHIAGTPFASFQAKLATKDETRELLESINVQLKNRASTQELTRRLDRYWPNLASTLPIAGHTPESIQSEATQLVAHITSGVKSAFDCENDLFHQRLIAKLRSFSASASGWSRGTMRVGEDDGLEFLADVYRKAEKSIFSTSIQHFFSPSSSKSRFNSKSILNKKETRLLLSAHGGSPASVVRVFLFKHRKDIKEADWAMMRLNARANVQVRIFIEELHLDWRFPDQVGRDFTIVDEGRAVGVTIFFGDHHQGADWDFSTNGFWEHYRPIRDALLKRSRPWSGRGRSF